MRIGPTTRAAPGCTCRYSTSWKTTSRMIPMASSVRNGRRSALQQFSSTSGSEEQAEQTGRGSRPGVGQSSAHTQQSGEHRLQDEAQTPGPRKPLRQFLQELSGEQVHAARLDGVQDRKRYRGNAHESRQHRHDGIASHLHVLGLRKQASPAKAVALEGGTG